MPASVHKAALVLDLFSVERPDWGPTEVADERVEPMVPSMERECCLLQVQLAGRRLDP